MAAIAFNTAQRAAERLETVLTAVGERIEPPVSYQMLQATAEAEPARAPAGDESASSATTFRPLDASIVSDAIPAFFIGRNGDGFWVARDAKGRIGGHFPAQGFRGVVRKNTERTDGMRNDFPDRQVRTRSEEQRQSAYPLSPAVDAPCAAFAAARLRRRRTNHGCDRAPQEGLNMTLLTHTGRPFEPAAYSSAKREQAGAANAHLAIIKRVCLIALTSLLALCASAASSLEDGGLSLALYPLTHGLNARATRRKPRLH